MRGWDCPKCGRVYAPWVAECGACNSTGTQLVKKKIPKGLFDPVLADFLCAGCKKNPCDGSSTVCGVEFFHRPQVGA